ncbi:hypothetical protein DFH29DRAFT_971546 [Suillus ampliporus]|nr:hypothetical protein DFH29DRAFT_971546 [Suillus ampliporus]
MINFDCSFFAVASSTAVLYDWVLTFVQEFELIWKRHWSFMTVLYICVCYARILYSLVMLGDLSSVSMSDLG